MGGLLQGPSHLPARSTQSSHMLHQGSGQPLPQPQAEPAFRPGSWDGAAGTVPSLFPADIERGSAEVRRQAAQFLTSKLACL